MNAALNSLRVEGVNILGYLDDLILWNSSSSELQVQSVRTMLVLERLGLTVNPVKSCSSPVSSRA